MELSYQSTEKKAAEEKSLGIDVELSELDVLMKELPEMEDLSKEDGSEEKRKLEEKSKAADIRKTAMENLGQTRKRHANPDNESDGEEVSKKTRRSSSEISEYLKDKRIRKLN